MHTLSRLAGTLAFPVLLAGCVGVAAPVEPAAAYYAPVPVVLQPGAAAQPLPASAYGATCAAGVYQCTLAVAGPIGGSCSCPGIGAPSYGVIH